MGEEVTEKIVFEYERFYLECMSQSKPGIFAKSHEIELKKGLMLLFKNVVHVEGEMEQKLLAIDNILDDVYRYAKDNRSRNDDVRNLMEKWLASF